ncbi:MAG TPA: DUF1385 domain-containing protein [Terriglobales bacterium]|nr:DUF1385 domain-containing protein [Terriglobales bacterium]
MKALRQYLKFLTAVQLLPALESGQEDILVGGQAVLEGVMMRSPHAWGIAVRKQNGEVVSHCEPLARPSDKHKWMSWPIVRGVITLGQAMALGFKALRYSANVALDEIPINDEGKTVQISGWMIAANAIVSVAFFIFMYKFLPLLAATELKRVNPIFGNQIIFNLVDGAIRIALFLLFIWGVSLFKDIRRVYEYHGAEHKTVFAFEAHDPMQPMAVQKYSTFHPRCGTSFLMTVMLISILVYTAIPVTTFWARFGIRVALLPVIAGVSYEIIRFAAKHRGSLFSVMTAPGLWLQRITTKNPGDDQVECAIEALNHAMELEAQRGGELVVA